MTSKALFLIGWLGFCGLTGLSAAAQTRYTITFLDPSGAQRYVLPMDINNSGEVVGSFYNANGLTRAFRTAPNAVVNASTDDLGALGSESYATAINSSGQVIGVSDYSKAFRTSPGGRIENPGSDLGPGLGYVLGYGINDAGVATGYYQLANWSYLAFRTPADRAIAPDTDNLGTLSQYWPGSYGYAINASGQVVGCSNTGSGQHRAFRADGVNMENLGTVGGRNSCAYAINDNGDVVGETSTSSGPWWTQAFLYTGSGPMTAIAVSPELQSKAHHITNAGVVVGGAEFSADTWHAYVYADGVMRDLSDELPAACGMVLTEARAINDVGQVVGIGWRGPFRFAFRLDPFGPARAIEFLIPQMRNYELPDGQVNELTAQLNAALAAIQRGNTGAAVNELQAFLQALDAVAKIQRGSRLNMHNASQLACTVRSISAAL